MYNIEIIRQMIHHYLYAPLFGFLGFVVTSKPFLQFLNVLSPVEGLIVNYMITYVTIYILQRIGLKIGSTHFDTHLHTIGSMFILFAYFIIFNWNSEYIYHFEKQENGGYANYSRITMQSEDGAVFYIWKKITGGNIELSRILTYTLTPFLLVALGILLIYQGTHTRLRKIKIG